MRSTASSSSLISMDCAGGDGRLSLPTGPRPPGLPEADRPHLPVSSLDGSRQGVALQERLGSKEIYLSLLFLVGLPYLSAKATDYWERIGGGIDAAGGDDALFGDDNNHDEDRLARARQLSSSTFRRGYPHAAAAYQLWLLGYNLSYLFQRTPYWRPWFSLMRVDVRRMGADDYPDTPPLIPPNAPSPFNTPSAFSRPCSARRPSSSSSRSNTRSPLAFSSSSSSSGGTALTIPDEDAVEAKEEEATLGLVKMTAVEQEGRMEMYPSLVRPGPSSPPHAESSTAQTQQNSSHPSSQSHPPTPATHPIAPWPGHSCPPLPQIRG
ncbi:unnamed protein product, partial [Tilletia controversa]